MKITKGIIPCAKKVVIYGPEGIGKSTFASQFPDPVFIDTEGSTNSMDVARLPKPTSWQMLLEEIQYVKDHPDVCKTLVIDTVDWAESMCIQSICDKHQKSGIEDFGYGNGYVYTKEEMGRFLNQLSCLLYFECTIAMFAIIRETPLRYQSNTFSIWFFRNFPAKICHQFLPGCF